MLWVLIRSEVLLMSTNTTYVVGTHCSEVLLMSTHNISFCGEIKKIINTSWLKTVPCLELCPAKTLNILRLALFNP